MARNTNNNKPNKEAKMSQRMKMAEEGVIAAQYTQNGWFVKVKPAFSINKVIFSFVMKGKSGEGFDIYIDLDRFDNWVDDIQSRMFLKVMAEEKAANEQYPKAFKYITGENGEKSVGICNSSKGNAYVINGCTVKDGSKVFANVPVDFDWLRTMAKYYKRCVEAEDVFGKYAKTVLDAANAYHTSVPSDQEDNLAGYDEAPAQKPEQVSSSEKKQPPVTIKPEETPSPEVKEPEPQVASVVVFTTGSFTDTKDGGSYIKAKVQKDNTECYILFPPTLISSLGKKYELMKTAASTDGFKMHVTGEQRVNSKGVVSYTAEKIC